VDLDLVVFESTLRKNHYPLSYTRPCFDFLIGARSLLERIEDSSGLKVTGVFVPSYIERVCRSSHLDMSVNEPTTRRSVIVNSLVSQDRELWNYIRAYIRESHGQTQSEVFQDAEGNIVFGIVDEVEPSGLWEKRQQQQEQEGRKKRRGSRSNAGQASQREVIGEGTGEAKADRSSTPSRVKTLPDELQERALLRYPWKLVEQNGAALEEDYAYLSSKYSLGEPKIGTADLRGSKFSFADSVEIESFVTIDSRTGPVIVADGVEIQSFSRISGPCFIGKSSQVKSAMIRGGCSIGSNCKVAGELEESIIFGYTNKSHDGFLGHSVVGSWVNLGAQTTNSDLKNTYGKISVNVGGKQVGTESIKVGVFIGDQAKTAIGTMITSGRKVGVGSQVFGTVLEDVPSFTIFAKSLGAKKSTELYLESAILTQRRMMERRGISMTDDYADLIRSIFEMTARERIFQHVSKRKFKLS
jgi:UDP-N-acetylglucosamine diphosphorylase/glucosamine-1-phosphate N-acetyltransferase